MGADPTSIGQFLPGIAHELNSPLQFASDSARFASEGTEDLLRALDGYRRVVEDIRTGALDPPAAAAAFADVDDACDIAYLRDHLERANHRTLDGLQRIGELIRAVMRATAVAKVEGDDLRGVIATALVVAQHEYKYVADTHVLGDTSARVAHAGQVTELLVAILANAGHSVRRMVEGTLRRGQIEIRVELVAAGVALHVSDDGAGFRGDADAVHRQAQRAGGTLVIDSADGFGTTATVTFPSLDDPKPEPRTSDGGA